MDQRTGSAADGLPGLVILDSVDSTNSHLAELWRSQEDLPAYKTVLASFQTKGRGRLGRDWVSPAATSLLCSILVPAKPELLTWIPLAAGLAAAESVRPKLPDLAVTLKWPNDILVGDSKVGGILTEHLGSRDGVEWVAVGIGINLTQDRSSLPPRYGNALPATSITLEGGSALDPAPLAISIANRLTDVIRRLNEDGASAVRASYENLSWTLGQDVVVYLPGGTTSKGRAVSIGDDGALIIEDFSGNSQTIRAGDVINVRAIPTTEPLSGGSLDPFGN